MPRRGFIPKREVLPDPVYGTVVVTKLINQIMLDGKRGTAQQVCYDAFEMIKQKTDKDPNEVFQAALNNVRGQATYNYGGYNTGANTTYNRSTGCSCCDICAAYMCADCLCSCCGRGC